jgi:hypothetical protein
VPGHELRINTLVAGTRPWQELGRLRWELLFNGETVPLANDEKVLRIAYDLVKGLLV